MENKFDFTWFCTSPVWRVTLLYISPHSSDVWLNRSQLDSPTGFTFNLLWKCLAAFGKHSIVMRETSREKWKYWLRADVRRVLTLSRPLKGPLGTWICRWLFENRWAGVFRSWAKLGWREGSAVESKVLSQRTSVPSIPVGQLMTRTSVNTCIHGYTNMHTLFKINNKINY